jgi:gliding-associated putative ABC transporter substrate-binding component GldG
MKAKNFAQSSLLVAAVVGSLVLLNLLALRFFARADLTHDRLYTLSQATKDTLGSLDDQVTVTAYFSDNLPPPYSSNARYVRDLLEEYRAASHGKLSFEMFDPAAQETAKDKQTKRETKRDIFGNTFREPTEVEKELAAAGIQPVKIRVVEEDQQQIKQAYMGLVIRHGEKKETVPVVQGTGGLEYELTSLIRKLTRAKTPVLGLLQGHGEVSDEHLRALHSLLGQTYEVRPVQPGPDGKFPADVDAIFVLGPKQPLDANAQQALDAFLSEGKAIAFFLDAVNVDPRTFQSQPASHGLGELLKGYGVTVGDQIVGDAQMKSLQVTEQRGNMMITQDLPYPFIPLVHRLEGDSPVSKGLSEIGFPFATEVIAQPADGREVTVLARSSVKSWLEKNPPNLDARRDWQNEQVVFDGKQHPLMVQVWGKLKSTSTADARLIVVGTSAVVQDELMTSRSNGALIQNVADWLLLDPAMVMMRTRGISTAPLKSELPNGVRVAAKFGNALGLPVLLMLYGLFRWRLREARRLKVAP